MEGGKGMAKEFMEKITLGGNYSVRFLGLLGISATLLWTVFTLISDILAPVEILLDAYLGLACFFVIIFEVSSSCNSCFLRYKVQVEYWAKFATRAWGKAIIYVFVGSVGIAKWTFFWVIIGSYNLFIGVIYVFASRSSSTKLHEIRTSAKAMLDADWESTFKKFDQNSDGHLDHTELQTMAAEFGSMLSINEVQVVINFLDTNNDGKVSIDEFKVWWETNKLAYV